MEYVEGLTEMQKFVFEPTFCCVCGVDDSRSLYTIDKYDEGVITFVCCNRCGLVYQNPKPTAETLVNFFSTQEFLSAKESGVDFDKFIGYWDYLGDEIPRQKIAAYRFGRLVELTGDRKLNILKGGCGPGTFLALAKSKGHNVTGVETSNFFCRYGKHKYGLDLIHSSFEDADLPEGTFDVVLLLGVLQHLNDPKLCFEKAWRLLKKDGYFFVNYMAFDSLMTRIQGQDYFIFRPQVLNFFPKNTFLHLLDNTGFEILSHGLDVQYTTLSKLVWLSRIRFLWAGLKFLPTDKIVLKLPIPGGFMARCRKKSA